MRNSNNPFDGAPRDPGARVTTNLKDEADPAEIKEDIGRTRAKMDRTLDELSDRLRPRRWIEDVVEAFKGSSTAGSVGEAGMARARELCREGAQVARRHPIPAALLLGGIAWLAVEQITGEPLIGRRRRSREWSGMEGESGPTGETGLEGIARPRGSVTGRPVYGSGYGAGAGQMAGRAGDYGASGPSASERIGRAREKVTGALHDTADAARSATHRARDAASHAAERISDVVHHTADRARDAGERVRDLTHDVSERASHIATETARHVSEGARIAQERGKETVESHPLAVAGAMFGMGLLLGIAVPSSRREDRWFGEESDDVKRAARRAGEGALERGKEVADAVKEEAERQGLTKEELIRRGERVLETAQHETKRAVESELSGITGSGAGRQLGGSGGETRPSGTEQSMSQQASKQASKQPGGESCPPGSSD